MRIRVWTAAFASTAISVAAHAFIAPAPAIDPGVAGMAAVQYSIAESERRRARGGAEAAAPPLRRLGEAPRTGTTPATYTYESTLMLRREAFDAFVGRVREQSPEQAATLARAFAGQDYGAIYSGIVADYGLSGNDAADPLTAYLVLGWLIANGKADTTADAVRAARRQVGALLADERRFRTPEVRAEVGEEFKILTVLTHAGWLSAQREGTLADYADGVVETVRQLAGTDLRAMTLTEDGFRTGRSVGGDTAAANDPGIGSGWLFGAAALAAALGLGWMVGRRGKARGA